MKTLIPFLLLFPFICFGQTPQGVNYQAVAYDANGFELSNKEVGVRISIIEGSAFGTPQLVEEHDVTTSEQGLFSLIIGQGALLGGEVSSLLDIPWGSNTYFLKIELDTENNGSYMDFGTQQFMSVPYALYAESSGALGPEGPDGEPGNNGVNCWDSNSNGLNDIEEDINDDGAYNALDCMWVLSNASSSPLGVILPYAASNPPEAWMICDGTELSRDEYSDLFSLIDTIYGSGDGFSTFNIPNLSGRIPVGKDVDSTIISNGADLGNFGGEETHTLTADEIASLSIHSSNGPAANVSGGAVPLYNMPKISSASFDGGDGYPDYVGWNSLATNAGDQAHNNMQPYLITNYIIRVVTESNTYIDGVSQIPPLEEILQLQYKVDSLEEVLSSENNEVYESYSLNSMTDTIYLSIKKGKLIILSGNISAGNPIPNCQCDLKITDANNIPISLELIKGMGFSTNYNNGTSFTSGLSSPFISNGSYYQNQGTNFSFQFEISEDINAKVYVSSSLMPCSYFSSNVTVRY